MCCELYYSEFWSLIWYMKEYISIIKQNPTEGVLQKEREFNQIYYEMCEEDKGYR